MPIMCSFWSVCPAQCLRSEESSWVTSAFRKAPFLRCCPGLDVGTLTLDHSDSLVLPATMLKGFPRQPRKQQHWQWYYVFISTGEEHFSGKGIFTVLQLFLLLHVLHLLRSNGGCKTWKNNDGLKIMRGLLSFKGTQLGNYIQSNCSVLFLYALRVWWPLPGGQQRQDLLHGHSWETHGKIKAPAKGCCERGCGDRWMAGAAAAQQLFFLRSSEDVKSQMHFLLGLIIIFVFKGEL